MGQYQQWLYHREVDEQLHARLEQLQTELAQLQVQAHALANVAPPSSDNVLIQTLLSTHEVRIALANDTKHTPLPEPLFIDEALAEAASAPFSPALLAWSRLPDLDAQTMYFQPSSQSGALSRSNGEGLLPQDMTMFFNQHPHTVPRPKLPALLENMISAPTTPDQLPDNPVDQQTVRTNRLVERWLERWRKTSSGSQEQREDQENASHRE